MDDHELIQQMKAKTLSRIRDRVVLIYKKAALDDQAFFSQCLHLDPWALDYLSEPAEPSPEALEWMCGAPLTDMAVSLLWAVEEAATRRTFVASSDNLAAVTKTMDFKDLARTTGFKEEDVSFILLHMTDSLVLIIREHVTIEIQIDRQPLRLQAKKSSVFRRIFKFIF